MKKKIFSIGIYKETVRQLSVIGFITLAVCVFSSVIPVITASYDGSIRMVTLSDMNVLLSFICRIISPWMALIAFGYGNKRKNADFYHALPYTRECIYLSIYGAVMTWMGIILTVTAALSVISHSLVPDEYAIIYGKVFLELLGLLLASALSVSAVSLACSLTGTALMNVLVSAIILFVPGLVTSLIGNTVTAEAPILMERYLGILSISRYNLYYGNFGSFLMGNGYIREYLPALAYTFAVALVYGGAACVLFKHRRSETAHNPSSTRGLHAVFRVIFGFVISLWAVMDMVAEGFDPANLIWLALCLVAYFAFELVTTKKWKNLVGAIWGWFAVAGLCALVLFAVNISVNTAYGFQPEAEAIEGVRIVEYGYSSDYRDDSLSLFEYAVEKSSEVTVKNGKINEILSKAIKDNTKYIGMRSTAYESSELVSVAVKVNGTERYRQIYIEHGDYNEMVRLLGECEEYVKCFTTLPEIKSASFYYYNMYKLSPVDFDEGMLSMLKEELSRVDFCNWHTYLKDSINVSNHLVLTTKEGVASTTLEIPVSIEQLPKTYSSLRTLYMDKAENRERCVEGISEMIGHTSESFENGYYRSDYLEVEAKIMVDGHYVPCELSFMKENGEWIQSDMTELLDKELEVLYDIFAEAKDKKLDTGSFAEVTYESYDNYKDGERLTAFFAISEEYEEYFLGWRSDIPDEIIIEEDSK